MAKVNYQYFGLGMSAEGSEGFVKAQATEFLKYVKSDDATRESQEKPITQPQTVADGVQWDVVAIYDNAGLPSIMHRFRRVTNEELFGGSRKTHPAFIIGGEVYDEIYISVYANTMIDGKPYSLPTQEPVCNITMEDFAQACFSKGEGWHCLTAAEWGLLALTSLKLGTLPHGNTSGGKWHGDETEAGKALDGSGKTATGTGPKTWTHDHTITGVHDLCGNIWEFCRGMRIVDGALQATENNDAAMPETDLSEHGSGWKPIKDNSGDAVFASFDDGTPVFTAKEKMEADWNGSRWGDVQMKCESEQLKELAFFAGEPDAYCYLDSTDGEYCLIRGGNWYRGATAGVFDSNLRNPRSSASGGIGGRSAFYKKHGTLITD